MNSLEEYDEECALIGQEMREAMMRDNVHRMISNEPFDTQINLPTLRALVKQHNGAMELLREIVAAHPEDTELMRRARRFVKRAK